MNGQGQPCTEAEFLELLNRCRGTIFKICLAYSDRSPGAVKDLFQDIACSLWQGYAQFDHGCSENTWVYRVALNTALMQLRKRVRQPDFLPLDDSLYERVAEEAADERLVRLYELIDALPYDEKMLVLMYIDRVPQRDIALQLGTTVAAVNKRIERIKRKLKKMNNEKE